MKVVYFQRLPNSSHHSIEREFATVRGALKDIDVEVRICRFESRGVFKRLYNILEAVLRQGDINHIAGDVHYLALLLPKKRTVLTVHDCGAMLRTHGLRRFLFQWIWLKIPVKRSAVVSVISEYTKREVLRYTSCPENQVRVVPVPVGSEFRPDPRPFHEDQPTILQVGTGANKNLGRLTEALTGIRCKLEIIGRPSAEARRALEQSGVPYEWAAGLSDADVAAKYRNADLVAFCSTYEGFGMPIVEAQAIGRPVVTSNLEPMISVAGNAACLVNPYDPISIRAGILRVIQDRGYREELVRHGFENAKQFSPESVAQSYMAVYRHLAVGAA